MEHGTAPAGEVFNFGLLHLEWTTALFVLVVFVITVFFLNMLLFKPIIRTIEARKMKLNANKDKVNGLNLSVESLEKDYEEKLSDAHEEIRLARQETFKSAKKEANKILEQVKASTSEKLNIAEKEIVADQGQAMDQVTALSKDLAQSIQAKVLA